MLSVAIKLRRVLSGHEFSLDTNFAVPSGITILFGASGSGKTTLLDCVAGLATPYEGRIEVGERIYFDSLQKINLETRRRRVGYVFQDLALFPHLSVEKNIQYGLNALTTSERIQRTNTVLESFRISHLRNRKPGDISGGEQQRVALARALVTEPCILLLDEPLAALDAATKSKIVADLRAWNEAHRIPILYVTHSREEVFALGERVLVMEQGRIIAQGTPHEVMNAPRQETVAQLAGFENILDATVVAAHIDRGTMTCRLNSSNIELETPLVRAEIGSSLRIGIRAGDILLATVHPAGLSASNIVSGKVVSFAQRDVIVEAIVNCGVEVAVHLTLAARDSLHLQVGQEMWLIVKTHSCHLMTA